MRRRSELAARECAVWTVIVAGHALILALFAHDMRQHVAEQIPTRSPGVLLMLSTAKPRAIATPRIELLALVTIDSTAMDSGPQPRLTLEPLAGQPSAAGEGNPAVDWSAAAVDAARSVIEQRQAAARPFRTAPVAAAFRKCEKDKPLPQWRPELSRVGLAGGVLPYVRIGERCFIGLGFFNCAIGKLPEANTDELLAALRDPERSESSVPDADQCVP